MNEANATKSEKDLFSPQKTILLANVFICTYVTTQTVTNCPTNLLTRHRIKFDRRDEKHERQKCD